MSLGIIYNKEVKEALQNRQPVVALESTIISHGMPYPQNVETAIAVEQIVRQHGAVPATIAILRGQIHVGLEEDGLEFLGKTSDVWKVSIRDIPYVISKGGNGATTVAATMRIASMAGIKIFVTGGIGGVHRNAPTTMDISADLAEMGKTSVAVVSAGVKSILDIGLTLEYLETLGVPVITFGSDHFPSFYSRNCGLSSPLRLDSTFDIARMLKVKWGFNLEGSVLIANPVPVEKEVPFEKIEEYINEALAAAAKEGIMGKQITPFLLKRIAENTGGESLSTNIELIKNNAMLGAKIAVEFATLI